MIYRKTYESPIGKLFLAAGDEALIGLWIRGRKSDRLCGRRGEETLAAQIRGSFGGTG